MTNRLRRNAQRLSVSLVLAALAATFSTTEASACYIIIRTCVTTQQYLLGFIPYGDPVTECTVRMQSCD